MYLPVSYLSSPSFVLHFTRFGIIAWIYFYRNYPSFFLLIWLCITFINVKTSKNLLITKYIAFPSLYYTITLMHYSNIPNLYIVPSNLNEKIKKEHYGLIKFEYDKNGTTIERIDDWGFGRNWPVVYIIYNDFKAYVYNVSIRNEE